MDAKTLAKYAREAEQYFTTQKRLTTGQTITVIKDNAPQWVQDFVRFTNGEFSLIDDYRMEFMTECLWALIDANGKPEEAREYLIKPEYTSDLTNWLNSHSNRVEYCTEAIAKLFPPRNAYDLPTISDILQEGWFLEATEVLDLVVSFLGDLENTEEE